MHSEINLEIKGVKKQYLIFNTPLQKLAFQLLGDRIKTNYIVNEALKDCSLELSKGESLGIVGLNGAGKSTLLQIIAGTLTPTEGKVKINGKVAALLELGSGFNSEFTGRENIYLSAATLGLSKNQTNDIFDEIVDFSGLSDYIDQPVKTYSSGMQVRLAFSVATATQPDILIVDEALSVGDGIFAKKSFDRIMQIRQRGACLIFCSHALFHIDIFCEKTLWLDKGKVRGYGPTGEVLPRYQEYLDELNGGDKITHEPLREKFSKAAVDSVLNSDSPIVTNEKLQVSNASTVKLISIKVSIDDNDDPPLKGVSMKSELSVDFTIRVSPNEPNPRAAVVVSDINGKILATCFSPVDETIKEYGSEFLHRKLSINPIMINKGEYRIGVYVLCHRGQYVYEWIDPITTIHLSNEGPHQGPLILSGQWF